jgi:hypothetical protein
MHATMASGPPGEPMGAFAREQAELAASGFGPTSCSAARTAASASAPRPRPSSSWPRA